MPRSRLQLATACVLAATLAACGNEAPTDADDGAPSAGEAGTTAPDDGDAAAPGPGDDHAGTVATACELAELARSDPEEAARRFDVELHEPLHDLADDLAETDRSAAGRLLEAKSRVEQVAADEPLDETALAEALDRLATILEEESEASCPQPPS